MPPRMLWAEEAVHSSAIYVCACMRAYTSTSVHPPEVDTECIFHLPSTLFFFETGYLIEPEVHWSARQARQQVPSQGSSHLCLSTVWIIGIQLLNVGCVCWRMEFRSSCLRRKHFTNRDISPVPDPPLWRGMLPSCLRICKDPYLESGACSILVTIVGCFGNKAHRICIEQVDSWLQIGLSYSRVNWTSCQIYSGRRMECGTRILVCERRSNTRRTIIGD